MRAARPAVLAGAFAVLSAGVALGLGPSHVGFGDLGALLAGHVSPIAREVLLHDRLPAVLLGLLVGASLAVAGVILQALLRNDLAEPYLVGVGPGAYLGVTAVALLAAGTRAFPSALARGAGALVGAVLVSAVVFTFARRARGLGPTLLLAGVALGAFVSAVATAALYTAVPDWQRVVTWLLGHLDPRGTGDLALVGVCLAVAGGAAVVRARDLDAVALGEEGAWLVGVHVSRLTVGMGLLAALLAAAAVATSGLIGFVGLLVPHLARRLSGPKHRLLVPTAAALGAGLLVLADALARTVHPPLVLPVGVVTAALGAPGLLVLLLKR